ncbi:unnamed protein product [Cuscuta campestris]|uniref:Uncharacterized protein n=1 Tax=Cuscuta campestris TaxID=132261 RepID=A0A484NEU2_9ASTE|nr:unnamed protein product [Cuscuta campestris]
MTWNDTMFSAIFGPAWQFGSSVSRLFGSRGFQASPTNTANVNRELTCIIPSSAVMWIGLPTSESESPGIFERRRRRRRMRTGQICEECCKYINIHKMSIDFRSTEKIAFLSPCN